MKNNFKRSFRTKRNVVMNLESDFSFIKMTWKNLLVIFFVLSSTFAISQQKTYCNPINIDYGYTPFEVFSKQGKHRATADPVIVNFKDQLFLFSTNQEGYWY